MEQIAVTQKQTRKAPEAPAEIRKVSCARMLHETPQNNSVPRMRFGKVTLNIASRRNVDYNYCDEKSIRDAPGTIKVSSAKEAIKSLRVAAQSDPRLRVVTITSSGDLLGSDTAFEVLAAIQKEFPHFTRCVVTDGLLLPRKLSRLQEVGVSAVILNVNAVDSDVGAQIYSSVSLNGKTLEGKEAFEVLSINQLEGLRNAADAGLLVEVNATYIPGVNSEHLVEVARIAKSLGACVVNVTPLSSSRFEGADMPSSEEMAQIRRDCADVCASEVLIYTAPNTLSYMSPEL